MDLTADCFAGENRNGLFNIFLQTLVVRDTFAHLPLQHCGLQMLDKAVDGLLRVLITKGATAKAFQTLEKVSAEYGSAHLSVGDVCRHSKSFESFLDNPRIDIGFLGVLDRLIYVRFDVVVSEARYSGYILSDGVEHAHERTGSSATYGRCWRCIVIP